jgi:hypothetical protein
LIILQLEGKNTRSLGAEVGVRNRVIGVACVLGMSVGCSNGGGSTGYSQTDGGADTSMTCNSGATQSCACPSGQSGTQTCSSIGWGACNCTLPDSGYMGPQVCGDGICSGTENCETCPVDCEQCASCSLAPTCTNGASLPASFSPLSAFDCTDTDGGSPRCGVGIDAGPSIQDTDCLAPQLKIGLADIRVILNGVGGSLTMFCMVGSDDGHSSELIITPEQTGIADHAAPILLPAAQATFWGQDTGSPKLSQFPLTLNYQCFEVDTPSAWQSVLGAIAGEAGSLASVPGNPYGWAFGAAAAGAAAAQAGLAAGNGTSMRLNYQQTIDPSSFLELTNGKTWTVEQSGNANGYNWDWALDVQSWGCSAARPSSP